MRVKPGLFRRARRNNPWSGVTWLLACAIAAMLLSPTLQASAETTASLKPFAGSWHGKGKLYLANGKTEAIRCRVNLKLLTHLGEASQSMRCVSTANEVMIRTTVKVDGRIIDGLWRETTLGVQGTIVGRIRDHETRLTMSGPKVEASLISTVAGNVQSVSINGQLGKIRNLKIQLLRAEKR